MTRVLLNTGISPNESNKYISYGRSPLQQAVEDGNLEMIDLLLESGADVNAPPAKIGGATALQLAAIKGRLGIGRRLIDLGANVNASGAEMHGRTALEGAAEYGRLDMVQLLLDSGADVVGDGCLQYFWAIRFAEDVLHVAVSNLLKNHREWTSLDHEMWGLFVALDWTGLEKLGSLEELVTSSAISASSVSSVSSAKSSSSRYRNEDDPEKVVLMDDYPDWEYDGIQEESFGEGRISPTEASPVDGILGRLQDSWAAICPGAGHDDTVLEYHTSSQVYDDTTWIQHLGNEENRFETSWDVGSTEAVHYVHAVQGFPIPDVNSQMAWNHQLRSATQYSQAAWEPGLLEGLDNGMRMSQQLFPAMNVDSAWNSQLGSADWNNPQDWHGTEIESAICSEIFESDMNWRDT
ncbi:hypothetical protein GQ607_011722 [Colletotrichum asianum]|uniref:Ankyrin n=1 Tax=Colletotrichum asianum TaxID=702518 RepID=A0A8H3ZRK9_9PEZI|nr:hypothetical protein GQ607_011722 [Colletotrichum asianum]